MDEPNANRQNNSSTGHGYVKQIGKRFHCRWWENGAYCDRDYVREPTLVKHVEDKHLYENDAESHRWCNYCNRHRRDLRTTRARLTEAFVEWTTCAMIALSDTGNSPTKTRQVKDRISSFLKHPPHLSQRPLARIPSSASLRNNSNSSSSSSTVPSPSSTPTQKTRKLPSSAAQLRSNSRPGTASPLGAGSASPRAGASTPTSAPPDRLAPYHLEKKRARYRIIERQREDSQAEIERLEEEEVRKGLRPPKVWSSVELREREEREKEEQTRIYDAIEEDLGQGGVRKKTKREMGRKEKEEDSRMMDNFGDMLKEYLTLQDSTESSSLSSSSSSSLAPPLPIADSSSSSDSEEEEEDADFVYDIYYRDLRPETSSASTPSTPGGSGFDVSSLEGLKRIGELAGLEDDEELLREEADSESEEEDNADQDSNEENDYRNDYPDEESEDSDRWDEDDGESQGGDSDF